MKSSDSSAIRFSIGDRVRIDIPDVTDPDHSRLHGEHGRVIEIIRDDAGQMTGMDRDSVIYRVALNNGSGKVDLRWRDLRLPID